MPPTHCFMISIIFSPTPIISAQKLFFIGLFLFGIIALAVNRIDDYCLTLILRFIYLTFMQVLRISQQFIRVFKNTIMI